MYLIYVCYGLTYLPKLKHYVATKKVQIILLNETRKLHKKAVKIGVQLGVRYAFRLSCIGIDSYLVLKPATLPSRVSLFEGIGRG